MPIVNRVADLLPAALAGCRSLWPVTVIIDNRDTAEECALSLADLAPGIAVHVPSVPLTTAQTMNLMLRLANNRDCRFFTWQHLDARCLNDSAAQLHAVAQEYVNKGLAWGVLFTNYDAFAAYNVHALNRIGGWDWKRFPYYFLDNDLHDRLREGGFPCLETGFPVEHLTPSQTIRSDPERWQINGPLFEASEKLYRQKHAFQPQNSGATPMRQNPMLFLEHIRCTPTYSALVAVLDSPEGNTLEIVDATTAEAQIEFHRWALAEVQKMTGPELRILEVGHNKGLFGLLLSSIAPRARLTAIDGNPKSAVAAEILERDTGMKVEFLEGNSCEILPGLSGRFDYAWIDGGHQTEVATSDLLECARLEIPWVAVDDTAYATVQAAVERWQLLTTYSEVPNPYLNYDSRRARLFVNVKTLTERRAPSDA